MPDCHDMKKGEIYVCKCGLQLEVVGACSNHCTDNACEDDECGCSFDCCGEPMSLKK